MHLNLFYEKSNLIPFCYLRVGYFMFNQQKNGAQQFRLCFVN